MNILIVLFTLGHVLEDFEVGGDDFVPRDKRQALQLPDEHHRVHVRAVCLHKAMFGKVLAQGLNIRRLLRNL